MGDSLRAFAIGRQAAQGTQAASLNWLSFIEDFQHTPNLKKDVPKFKTNRRWMEYRATAQTRFDEVTVRGRVDSTEIGWFLVGGFGPPTTVVHVHTFKAGSSQLTPVSATNSMYLTVAWMEGLSNLWWVMIDAKVHQFNLAIDATGNITFDATIRGIKAVPTVSPPTPAYTPPADNSPFNPFQVVLTKGGVGACLVSARMSFMNNFDPFYCTPTVALGAGAEHGLFPVRFTEGETSGTYDFTYEYTADAGSSFYDFRHDVNEAWVIEATDPDTTGGGFTPTFHLALPVLAGTGGNIDRSKPNVLQHVTGSILYDAASGTGATGVLTNGLTNYNGT